MIGPEPGDTVSPLHAEIVESTREARDPVCEFGICTARVAVNQRELVRRDPRPSLDPRTHPAITHGEDCFASRRTHTRRYGATVEAGAGVVGAVLVGVTVVAVTVVGVVMTVVGVTVPGVVVAVPVEDGVVAPAVVVVTDATVVVLFPLGVF